MAYNEELAQRIRQHMLPMQHITEKKMFGGLSFLYKGKMSVGIVGEQLAVRVVSEKFENVLAREHVAQMDFTKRPMKDFVYVNEPAFATETQLAQWIELGIEHAERNSKK